MLSGTFSDQINPRRFDVHSKYRLHSHQRAIIARNKTDREEEVALRLRVGRVGYKQWLNELYVYLLPGIEHENILPFLGFEKRRSDDDQQQDSSWFNVREILDNCSDDEEANDYYNRNPSESTGGGGGGNYDGGDDDDDISNPVERQSDRRLRFKLYERRRASQKNHFNYWILNDYSGCITLQHYLMVQPIDWPTLLKIAHGITAGLEFLHENADYNYDELASRKIVDGFIRSTKGAIKKIAFKDSSGCIHMKPPHKLTIIHRNLSSLNIVLRRDNTPCIWNFGYAYVYHPFQPINHDHLVDKPIKKIHMTSPYSPPEVLMGKAYFTLTNMKAIDMYACGMIFWELMSRCILPPLDKSASKLEQQQRFQVGAYRAPFEVEFNTGKQVTQQLLYHAVVRIEARPQVSPSWVLGTTTSLFVETIRNLWDHDYDARIHTATVMKRL